MAVERGDMALADPVAKYLPAGGQSPRTRRPRK